MITLSECSIKSISSLKSSSCKQKDFLLIDGTFKGQIYPSIQYKALFVSIFFLVIEKNLYLRIVTEKIIFKVLSILRMFFGWNIN